MVVVMVAVVVVVVVVVVVAAAADEEGGRGRRKVVRGEVEGTRFRGESRYGGGGRPTEGGEDRDTKGFDVQPFHRLYFSAPFYPLAVYHPIP